MGRKILFVIFAIFAICGQGQTVQRGTVKEYNERNRKTALPGVELRVSGAGSTVSDAGGDFELVFRILGPGRKVNVSSIEKAGYIVFNKDALEQWNINPDERFVVVMCRSDKFKTICENYYRTTEEHYARQYRKSQQELERLRSENKVKDEEYRKRLQELQDSYMQQLENLDNYIDRFARFDLSEISEGEREIVELVEQGLFDEAVQKYEELRITEQLVQALQQRAKLRDAVAAVEVSVDSLYAAADRQITTLQLAGASNNGRVLEIYTSIADADSANVEWLLETGLYAQVYLADYDAAKKYFEKALKSALAKGDTEGALKGYAGLGAVYADENAFEQSMECYDKALALGVTDNPGLATVYSNRGTNYLRQGNPEQANVEYMKALDVLERYDMLETIEAFNIYTNIASSFSLSAMYDKALEYYLKAYALDGKMQDSSPAESAMLRNNMGMLYYYTGQYDNALEFFEGALEAMKKIYGPEHPNIGLVYQNMGIIYMNRGDYDKSVENLEKARGITEKFWGEKHLEMGNYYNNMAMILYNTGDVDRALEEYNKALSIYLELAGEESAIVAKCYNNLAMCHMQKGDAEKAMAALEKSRDIYEKTGFGNHPDMAMILNNIGYLHSTRGELAEASESYKKALSIQLKTQGENHPDVGTSYNNIGLLHMSSGEYDKALDYFVKATEIWERAYGEHPNVATSYLNLGGVAYQSGDAEKALTYFLKAQDMMLKTAGESHANMPNIYVGLGRSYQTLGKYEDAVKAYEKAREFYKTQFGEESNYVRQIDALIGVCKSSETSN
ncbi:MAG: tetratricopeptide repeat protein [Muribaculaceae bacterium]|nr:tetratricopeptide repeat protein [Muribaculaceae bacterium]